MEEIELIRAARRGAVEAYESLFERYVGIVYLFLLMFINSHSKQSANISLNLVHIAFDRLFSQLPYTSPHVKVGRLLYAVVSQLAAEAIYRLNSGSCPCAEAERRGSVDGNTVTPFANIPDLDEPTRQFLFCVRKLPDNYHLPVLIKWATPESQAALSQFTGFLPHDLEMLASRADLLLLDQLPAHLAAQKTAIIESLKYPRNEIKRFMEQWTQSLPPTVYEVFSSCFSKFVALLCIGAITIYLALAWRYSSRFPFTPLRHEGETVELKSVISLLLGISTVPVILALFIKLAARLDRWYTRKKWQKKSRDAC